MMNTKKILLLAVTLPLLLQGCGKLNDVSICKDEIKNTLKDPKTAELEYITSYSWKDNQKTSRVTIKTRASNSFGGFLTKEISCNFDHDGKFVNINPY